MLDAVGAGWFVYDEHAVEIAVQIELPGAVIGHGNVVPDIAGDRRRSDDRVVQPVSPAPGRSFFEIGGQLV